MQISQLSTYCTTMYNIFLHLKSHSELPDLFSRSARYNLLKNWMFAPKLTIVKLLTPGNQFSYKERLMVFTSKMKLSLKFIFRKVLATEDVGKLRYQVFL